MSMKLVKRFDDLVGRLDQAADSSFGNEQLVVPDPDPSIRAIWVVGAVHAGDEGRDALVVADEVLSERPLIGEVRIIDDVGHRNLAIVTDDHDVLDARRAAV